MSIRRIELCVDPSRSPRAYRIAETLLITDIVNASLRPFAAPMTVAWSPARSATASAPEIEQLVYSGPGWINREWLQVSVWRGAGGYRIRLDTIADFWVSALGDQITLLQTGAGQDAESAALGAPLMLGLALQGVFGLHASVAMRDDQLVAFVGESGAGKSTLARYLAESAAAGWRRVIDDTLPLAQEQGLVQALPHFPQLKLAEAAQPVHLAPPRMALQAIFVLQPPAADQAVTLSPLSPRDAAVALVQHTVGGRLFDPPLLQRHLEFCTLLASQVPVFALAYPRTLEALPRVQAALLAAPAAA